MADGLPCFAPDLDREDRDYDPAAYRALAELEARSFWFANRNRLIAWAVRRYAPQAAKVLDAGCGMGHVLHALREALPAAELAASDIHASGLAIAAERHGAQVSFLQTDLRRLPFRAEFDLIGCFDVVEHIDEDARVLEELRAALADGGVLLLTVPQHMWLWSPADDAAHHKRRYTRPELAGKLMAAGLQPLLLRSFMSLLLPALMLARWQSRRQGSYDIRREADLPRALDGIFGAVCFIERLSIAGGIAFPAGGSLLAVARRI